LPARAGAPAIERTGPAVLVRRPELIFSSAQVALGDSGFEQATEQLRRSITGETLFENRYSVAGGDSSFQVEGLLTQDATVAIEVIAAAP
jgi:hypothetical protein